MKILIVGSGGREHAIAWKLLEDEKIEKIYIAPGNASEKLIGKIENVNLNNDINEYVNFAKKNDVYLTIVGSEELLVKGIVDEFKNNNLKIFGPNKNAAILEGSKAFSKNFMKKYGIKTAMYEIFNDVEKAMEFLKEYNKFPVVIKASGLAAGKGVVICENMEDAANTIEEIMVNKKFGESGNEVVIEEFLEGVEASILSFTDCNVILPLLSAKDHKKIGENETGLNTGGMGVIAPNPYVNDEVFEKFKNNIMIPTLKGMKQEKMDFEGVIFFGLMITKEDVYLLEYNMRMGDPETQCILPLMKSNLLEIIEEAMKKNLEKVEIKWKKGHSCCVVATAKGYPEDYKKGDEIEGIFDVAKNINLFVAGVKYDENKFLTSGGRVLNIVSTAETLEEAKKIAYEEIKKINFNGIYYRKDIGNIIKN